jgi:hypothetical protein
MALASSIQITDQDIRTTSLNKGGEKLGQLANTSDGRQYVYSANQSTTLTLAPGKNTQGPTSIANHINQTGTVNAIGTSSITFTLGATATTAGQYTDGYFVVNKNTGAGQALLISGNTVTAGSVAVTVTLKDSLIAATDTTSKFSLYQNNYAKTILYAHAAPTVTVPTGIPNVTVPVATTASPFSYFWNQIGGECSVLADAATWVGQFDGIIASTLTDGAVGIQAAATVQPTIGYALDLLVSTEYRPVFLTVGA